MDQIGGGGLPVGVGMQTSMHAKIDVHRTDKPFSIGRIRRCSASCVQGGTGVENGL